MRARAENLVIVLVVVALAGAPALAQSTADPCADPQTQRDMNACAWESWQKADAALNATWERLREQLKRLEAELGYEGWFDAALEGQRGWLSYRDGQCEAEGFAARGGSMEPMLVFYCKARVTRRRVEQLEGMIEAGG